jgi:hypothetical protein
MNDNALLQHVCQSLFFKRSRESNVCGIIMGTQTGRYFIILEEAQSEAKGSDQEGSQAYGRGWKY